MPSIASHTTLTGVEYIRIGHGVLDFGTEDEEYTWWCQEDAKWEIEGGDIVNGDEDRFLVTPPEGEEFECRINATSEEGNEGPVKCVIV